MPLSYHHTKRNSNIDKKTVEYWKERDFDMAINRMANELAADILDTEYGHIFNNKQANFFEVVWKVVRGYSESINLEDVTFEELYFQTRKELISTLEAEEAKILGSDIFNFEYIS